MEISLALEIRLLKAWCCRVAIWALLSSHYEFACVVSCASCLASCVVESRVVSFLSLCPGHIGLVDEGIAEIGCHWHGCIELVSPRRSGNLILVRVVTGVRSESGDG